MEERRQASPPCVFARSLAQDAVGCPRVLANRLMSALAPINDGFSPKSGRALVGTSGWNYAHWKGRFYPGGMRPANWLRYYTEHFRTVEVNYSFYRVPPREAVGQWAREVPEDFCFVLKLWRGVTHYRKLKDSTALLERFFAAAQAVPHAMRGPLLVQLPPNQGCDLPKLDHFFDDLDAVTSPDRWNIAVEFRNPKWLGDETYELLDRRGAALCLHDMAGSQIAEPNRAPFVYVRRHGSQALGRGGYSDEQVHGDAERIGHWLSQGRDVYVYYNNDLDGWAVTNAMQLKRLVQGIGSPTMP